MYNSANPIAGTSLSMELLYEKYYHKVYSYALVKTNCTYASKDITQDVFLKLLLHEEKLMGAKSLDAYIYRMASNEFVDHLRKNKRSKKEDEKWWSERTDDVYTTHEKLQEAEYRRALAKAVRRLPKGERLVYELQCEWDWKREDIARVLKLSPNTVKEQIRNARKKVRNWVLRQVA